MKKDNRTTHKPYQSETDRLLTLLDQHFNLDELKEMCLSLEVDFDNIAGETKAAKCRELLIYLFREDRLSDLIAYSRRERPAFKWPDPDAIKLGGLTSDLAEDLAALEVHRRRVAGEKKAAVVESFTLQAGKTLTLHGKSYVVRKVLVQKHFGPVTVASARVSDVSLNRNAGICQFQALADTTEANVILNQAVRKAQGYNRAITNAKYLPHLYDMVDNSPWAVWLVMQWLDAQPLAGHFSKDSPLPDKEKLALLLGWMADICEALVDLHRQRWSHGHINAHTIVLPYRERRAYLIDPVFSGQTDRVTIDYPKFNPGADLRDLAAVLYQAITHHPAQSRPASDFNPAVPLQLNQVLQMALEGRAESAYAFRRELLSTRHVL